LTEEDYERTILALRKPAGARPAPSQPVLVSQPGATAARRTDGGTPVTQPPMQSSQPGSQPTSFSATTLTPWKLEIMPELQTALSMQVGPMAKLLLKNAAAQAQDVDDLCGKLLPHIPTDKGRTQFLESVRTIKKKLGIGTTLSSGSGSRFATIMGGATQHGGATLTATTQLPLDPATLEMAEQKLTPFIGPIAKVMVKRAAKISSTRHEFHRLLAENIGTEQDRIKFLKEVGDL
jgi:serine/threonine-protein kinase